MTINPKDVPDYLKQQRSDPEWQARLRLMKNSPAFLEKMDGSWEAIFDEPVKK